MKYFSPSTKGFYCHSIHGEAIPADAVAISDESYTELLNQQASGRVNFEVHDGFVVAIPIEAPTLTTDQRKARLINRVQQQLDATARTRNYDGILSLCTYATSSIEQFATEGQAGIAYRDGAWATCYQVMAQVEAGAIAEPTAEELIALIPPIAW